MSALALQYVLIGLAVMASAWVVANKQFPHAMRRARVAVAVPLVREGRASWLRRIGRIIAPPGVADAAACGGCNNCGPSGPGR